MNILSLIMIIIKNAPAIESFVSAAWLGWHQFKAGYYQAEAAKTVQNALKSESTNDINSQLGKDL